LRFEQFPDGEVEVRVWGDGAEEAVELVPDLLGAGDPSASWRPPHPLLRELTARTAGMRIGRTRRVFEALVPSVLEQKVTGAEARSAWRWLVRRHGSPAPGPAPERLRVFPPPEVWRRIPSWDWHRAEVDGKRSRTVLNAAGRARALERTVGAAAPRDLLETLPGIGIWTSAEIAQRAYGDVDAVSVGDFHLPALVGWALTGQRVDDDGMLELLEPFRPFRYRAVRLIELGGLKPPRFGPRLSPRSFASI
jgi:3-methyladenine DNA glycosylase/8-oxoguanine DNA glycosylase